MSVIKRPPLGGYKDCTTSLHLTKDLLAMVRASATATELNQSDIIRTATKRYIENELVPGLTASEKDRYELALKMEQEAMQMAKPEADDFLENL